MIGFQQLRRDLKKLKDILHSIAEGGAAGSAGAEEEQERGVREEVESRRCQRKLTKRLGPILSLIGSDRIAEYLGSRSHEAIWEEMNTNEDRQTRVIKWLEAMNSSQVSGEIGEMNKRTQALNVQEVYRIPKGIAMRRVIEKEQSPQCQIEMDTITEHFRKTWARPEDDFVEAAEGSVFRLEAKIKEEDEAEM
jgi:hypothetical protein